MTKCESRKRNAVQTCLICLYTCRHIYYILIGMFDMNYTLSSTRIPVLRRFSQIVQNMQSYCDLHTYVYYIITYIYIASLHTYIYIYIRISLCANLFKISYDFVAYLLSNCCASNWVVCRHSNTLDNCE